MLEFYAARFLSASHQVSRLGGFAYHAATDNGGFGVNERGWPQHREDILALSKALEELGLLVSKKAADRILELMDSVPPISNEDGVTARVFSQENTQKLVQLIDETAQRVEDELGSRFLISMSAENAPYYEGQKSAFGSNVLAKFGSLQYEIEEAGKCYALGRSTACAFHSIRCLEAGIRAIARCLQIPDPTKGSQRNWANVKKTIKDKMDILWPVPADRFSGDGELFEDFFASLSAMQNPWRNATMHLDQKYTKEEAKHMMDVIGGFMTRIASRMDEDGNQFA